MDTISDHKLFKSFFISNPETDSECGIARKCFDILGVFIIVVDSNWEIKFINKKAYKVLEHAGNDLTGKSFIKKLVINEDQRGVRAGLKQIFNPKSKVSSANILYRLRTSSGNEIIIDSDSRKIIDDTGKLLGILISGKDVTEYNVSKKNLKKDINLYKILLNKIPEVNVFVFDMNNRFTLAEGIEMKNLGLSPVDFEDNYLSDIPLKKLKIIWEPLFETVLKGGSISKEYKLRNYNYLFRASPLRDAAGNIHSGLVVTRNVTSQKLSEKILKKAKDEAVKSVNIKTDFLARVSHEIRTPLNAIMGFTEQLLQTDLSALQAEYVNIVDNSSELLLSLVNDLLVMSKIEADQIRFDVQPFIIRNTVNYVYKALSVKAARKNLEFGYSVDKRLDRAVKGDSFRLEQILINLLTNAIKFTSKGVVKLDCSLHRETSDDVIIRFDVTDTGIGVSKKHLKFIFEQYSQAKSKGSRGQEGIGLGLAICKNLIELQNGSLTVSSQQGTGTTFSFMIPYRKAEDEDLPVYYSEKTGGRGLAGIKVLVVEDDSINMLLATTILKKLKCIVDTAHNGTTAIEKLRSGTFDLVLLDIRLPDINGAEIAKFVRNNIKGKETKIIALTAQAMKDDIRKYEEAGIDDFVVKPFKEAYLYSKICEVLNLAKVTVQRPKTEVILRSEMNPRPYDLYELKRMAGNDADFINQTLELFIENSENAIKSFKHYLRKNDYKQIGETAHKILPSYRHLEVDSVIPGLTELKTRTLVDKEPGDIGDLVYDTIKEIESLIVMLRGEMSGTKQ
jgi:PAS domain S-box-containing protein